MTNKDPLKLCACGCGETFTSKNARRRFLNEIHTERQNARDRYAIHRARITEGKRNRYQSDPAYRARVLSYRTLEERRASYWKKYRDKHIAKAANERARLADKYVRQVLINNNRNLRNTRIPQALIEAKRAHLLLRRATR